MTAFSVVVPFWPDRPPEEAREVAVTAEQLGYNEVWIGEMATYDAFALGTDLGLRTSLSLTIGPLAVGVRTPVTMAMGLASVAHLTGSLVRLAIGASSPTVVSRWHGRRWGEGAIQIAETADILGQLLSGARSSLDGRRLSSHGFRLRLPSPTDHLTIAAFGPLTLAVAAEKADRVVLNMVSTATVARVAEKLRSEGGDAQLAVWVTAALDPGPDAHEQMAGARAGYLAAPGYSSMLREAGFGDLVDLARGAPHPAKLIEAIPPEIDDVVGVAGDGPHLIRRVKEYLAAGADEICIVPVTAGDPGGRRTLGCLAPEPGTGETARYHGPPNLPKA